MIPSPTRPLYYRSLRRILEPECEPVTLLEAKQHCRVDITEDDIYIEQLIRVAREYAETYCDMTFISTQYQMRIDRFPSEFMLPRPPASPDHDEIYITYRVGSDEQFALDPNDFRFDRDVVPAMIYSRFNGFWPATTYDRGAVEIVWWAGFGVSPRSVPAKIKHAILMLVHHFYERRMVSDNMGAGEVPFGVRSLLDASKWGAYS